MCMSVVFSFQSFFYLQANKMGFPGLFCHNGVGDPLATPPPAHCGIPPYGGLDPKTMGKFSTSIYVHILFWYFFVLKKGNHLGCIYDLKTLHTCESLEHFI